MKKLTIPAFLILLAVMAVMLINCGKEEPVRAMPVSVISESTLQEVLNISELSTVEYNYNAVVKKYAEDQTTVMYHVAYEGTIKAGIDFANIRFEVDNESRRIYVTLPEVRIQECNVNASTLAYIFTDDAYNVPTVPTEAYSLSLADLSNRAASEPELMKLAWENACSAVKALVEPWVSGEYTVEFR